MTKADPTTFEEALSALEHDAETALKALAAAVKEAKKVKSAAALGRARELQQA